MHNQNKKILKVLAALFLIVLILFTSQGAARLFRIKCIDITSPILASFNNLIVFSERLLPFASLREENKALKEKIDLLTRKVEEANVIVQENQRLKDLLNFRKAIPYTTMPAQVIGRDPSNWSNSLIIDKGLSQGIRQNMAVMSTRGIIGRVVEVGQRSSKILLITDPNSRVGAVIRRNRQGGILVGLPDGKCKMIYIALDSDVSPGDKVITAGFGSVFPKGILIGEVEKVGREAGRLYKYAIIRPSQDLSKLEEVLCIR